MKKEIKKQNKYPLFYGENFDNYESIINRTIDLCKKIILKGNFIFSWSEESIKVNPTGFKYNYRKYYTSFGHFNIKESEKLSKDEFELKLYRLSVRHSVRFLLEYDREWIWENYLVFRSTLNSNVNNIEEFNKDYIIKKVDYKKKFGKNSKIDF